MSGIVSGVGLFSGINTQELIDQLIAADSQPLVMLQQRLEAITTQRTAFAGLTAQLLALKGAASQFDQLSFFRKTKAQSSDPTIFTATTTDNASLGSFAFRVQSLATRHQLISAGFANKDQIPVGSGTIALEVGEGKISKPSYLDELNGGNGVRRGIIEIEDQSGQTAQIDLRNSLTLQDVVTAINAESKIDVEASVVGDQIRLQDVSAATTGGVLAVSDLGGGFMAADLGIADSVTYVSGDDGSRLLLGSDINNVTSQTGIDLLNDGNGIRRNTNGADLVFEMLVSGETFNVELNDKMDVTTALATLNNGNGVQPGDFSIRSSSGVEFDVDLAASYDFGDGYGPRPVRLVSDVVTVINQAATAAGADVVASIDINTNQLVITDNTSGSDSLQVIPGSGSTVADLGLNAEVEGGVLRGNEVYHISNLGDVIRAINYAAGNYDLATGLTQHVQASVAANGNGIELRRIDGGAADGFKVSRGSYGSIGDSHAADDLGLIGSGATEAVSTGDTLHGQNFWAGLNSVLLRSLNGGQGVTLGTVNITAKDGTVISVDLANPPSGEPPQSIHDVIQAINDAIEALPDEVAIHAEINAVGNGLAIVDQTGGSGSLSVSHSGAGLGLNGSTNGTVLNSGNLQLQYISENTKLGSLNNGAGVGLGQFNITSRNGTTLTINVTENQKTVGDLLRIINIQGASNHIVAEINATGDGIVIRDETPTGEITGELAIQDEEGQVAKKLRLLGGAQVDPDNPDQQIVDGSYEFKITVAADDTLSDVADKLSAAGLGLSVSIINDGSSLNPFRLSISSSLTGTQGEMMLDWGSTGLTMQTLTQPQDAVLFFGSEGSSNPIAIRSSSNSVANVVQGVTIDLLGTSEETVDLTVSKDIDAVVEAMKGFVEAYNSVTGQIDDLTFFNAESLESGPLRSDPTVRTVETRIRSMIQKVIATGETEFSRFATMGITIGNGGQLVFDEARFREALAENPEAIEEFFTLSETTDGTQIDSDTGEPVQIFHGLGMGYLIDDILDELTTSADGLLARKDDSLQRQEDLINDRAENMLDLLDAKRARLEKQFAGLETALSSLSSQQSALSALSANLGIT
ncbi:MAG: hypothetical protein HJJLKODD_00220 [Phycisphaerae bacterium]|nr:hypothetical protein [Phycisphaerae bacterium]